MLFRSGSRFSGAQNYPGREGQNGCSRGGQWLWPFFSLGQEWRLETHRETQTANSGEEQHKGWSSLSPPTWSWSLWSYRGLRSKPAHRREWEWPAALPSSALVVWADLSTSLRCFWGRAAGGGVGIDDKVRNKDGKVEAGSWVLHSFPFPRPNSCSSPPAPKCPRCRETERERVGGLAGLELTAVFPLVLPRASSPWISMAWLTPMSSCTCCLEPARYWLASPLP